MVMLMSLTLTMLHITIHDSGAQKQLRLSKEDAQECFAKMVGEGLLRKVNRR